MTTMNDTCTKIMIRTAIPFLPPLLPIPPMRLLFPLPSAAFRRGFTTALPLLKSSKPAARHHPHHHHSRPASRTGGSPTPRGAPLHPPAPRSAPLPGSNTAAAGPTGFVSANVVGSAAGGPGSWWRAQSKSTRASLAALGVSGYVIAAWVAYQALAEKKDGQGAMTSGGTNAAVTSRSRTIETSKGGAPVPTPSSVCQQADHKHVYDDLAPSYDWSIGWDELVMGLLLVRRWVISHAKGDTLELATGTGRNTRYYPPSPTVTSLTLTDTSVPMLDQAVRTHLTKTSPAGQPLTLATTRSNIPTRVLPADAHSLPLPAASFDTIVSTFSLCSFSDPVRAVGEALRVLKPGGSLWLVEHGRGKYAWLNRSLDNNAQRHAEKWGCWYNRDIGAIVEEAVAKEGEGKRDNNKGVYVKRMYRLHFGTTWIVEVVKEG